MGDGEQQELMSGLNIMRRMPPSSIEQNLSGLLNLAPQLTDEFLQRVDQPLNVETCADTGKKYLLCDYNRDGDSYRSPWSNKYNPAIDDGEGFFPSDDLRQLEIQFNEVFDAYRDLYYDNGGVSSVYLWDLDNGFAGCFLVKKAVENQVFVKAGSWDAIHVMEVETKGKSASYRLTTTVILSMTVAREELGTTNLSGSLSRQSELKDQPQSADKGHLQYIGRMIEDMEIDMRSSLDNLYIQKTREIINGCRKPHAGAGAVGVGSIFVGDLSSAVAKHGANRKTDSEM